MVEILVVLAIASVLASLSIPNINSYLVNSRVKSYAHDLAYAVRYARSEAQRTASTVNLVSVDNDFAKGACISSGNNCTNDAEVLRVINAPPGVLTTSTDSQISFDNRGWRSMPASGSVELSVLSQGCSQGYSRNHQYEILITRTGVTKLEKKTCA